MSDITYTIGERVEVVCLDDGCDHPRRRLATVVSVDAYGHYPCVVLEAGHVPDRTGHRLAKVGGI